MGGGDNLRLIQVMRRVIMHLAQHQYIGPGSSLHPRPVPSRHRPTEPPRFSLDEMLNLAGLPLQVAAHLTKGSGFQLTDPFF